MIGNELLTNQEKYFSPGKNQEGFNDYRFERKFLNPNYSYENLENIVRFNMAHFREIFYQRTINNIYLDTSDWDMFFANYNGHSQRMKIRVRWYGEMFGLISKPALEIKIRNGQLNRKETYPIQQFDINTGFQSDRLISNILESDIPENIKVRIKTLIPTLLNQYHRKYFLSADGNFRVTIDKGLKYYKVQKFDNFFTNNWSTDVFSILELKYNMGNDELSQIITNQFPFRLTKSSKYMMGINRIYNLAGF